MFCAFSSFIQIGDNLNRIWTGIILISIFYGLGTGRFESLAQCILALPQEGLALVVTLVFSACFWSGIMTIMYDSGLIDGVAKALDPLLKRIMPNLKNEEAKKYIASNIAANIFGLGFAATPAGLKAMKVLKEISPEDDETASDEMVTFLILNTAGVTLIPTTVMAIRQSYGAANPADFLILSIIGTFFSCVVGLFFDRVYQKKNKKKLLKIKK